MSTKIKQYLIQGLFLPVLLAVLAGCYRAPMRQGNMPAGEIGHQLYRGMSKKQVKERLGEPVLVNLFNGNEEWHYVYIASASRRHKAVKMIWVLLFSGGKLVSCNRLR